MTQVIIIHGGTTFSNYKSYVDYLRSKPISVERMIRTPTWKDTLQEDLGADYTVLNPTMPNATNARYDEWALWFERISEVIEDGCILIGHSLGGIFLAKYLSEQDFPRQIKAAILVAAPFDDESDESLTDFKLTNISPRFAKQAGDISLFFGTDDPVVSATEADKYRRELPSAHITLMSAPDHFNSSHFPELVAAIHNSTHA